MNDVGAIAGPGFAAVLFDLDGVLVDTRRLHVRAWTETFDRLLDHLGAGEAFDPVGDYGRFVDGKPRYDGVRSFLASRGIDLPEGASDAEPGLDNVRAVGNAKNRRYGELLDDEGADVLPGVPELVAGLHRRGIAIAVVSSSRNARRVLAAVGLDDVVEVIVDGTDLARLDVPGKPDPALFLHAAERLGVAPGRCVVVEDAPAGVEAGRAGGFGLVVGIASDDQAAAALTAGGAHVVVAGPGHLGPDPDSWASGGAGPPAGDGSAGGDGADGREEPDALVAFGPIAQRLGPAPLVCCDYDGTLSPIVDDPEAATLSDPARRALERLAGRCAVAIVSGRGLADVRERVGLEGLYFAGSHGFEIAGPGGLYREHEPAAALLGELDRVERELVEATRSCDGVQVERKRYAIAVHTRRAASEAIRQRAGALAAEHGERVEGLRTQHGKEVVEILPDLDWDKGAAVVHLAGVVAKTRGGSADTVPVLYLGDDTTDEDAFGRIAAEGLGVGVRVGPGETAAEFRLDGVDDVVELLERLAALL
ncbi:MAG: trehalose-phosphatase [Acidimicrobiales bacterium]